MASPNPTTIFQRAQRVGSPEIPVGQSVSIVLQRGLNLSQGIATWLRLWWRTIATQQELAEIDDRMVADLGIFRAQADFELSQAPWTICKRTDAQNVEHDRAFARAHTA